MYKLLPSDTDICKRSEKYCRYDQNNDTDPDTCRNQILFAEISSQQGQQTGKSLPGADDIQQIFSSRQHSLPQSPEQDISVWKEFLSVFTESIRFLTVFCLFSYQVSQIITQILCRTKTTDISAVIPSENRCCYNQFPAAERTGFPYA